ncbi:MAG TPA: septal ring lytic transglycosylase RlpA family protein [Edaphobacter sp.]
MKMIPAEMREKSISMMKAGVAAVTLIFTLGGAASATDVAPNATKIKSDTKPRRWYQIGQASWYGRHFQGRTTANGEQFDMNGLTCAHRSLPLNSWIRVTNLKNRKSIFVRVNDRGPVPQNRIVDLSYAAAQAVGLAGIGKVKLETVRGGDLELTQALLAQLKMPLVPVYGE